MFDKYRKEVELLRQRDTECTTQWEELIFNPEKMEQQIRNSGPEDIRSFQAHMDRNLNTYQVNLIKDNCKSFCWNPRLLQN